MLLTPCSNIASDLLSKSGRALGAEELLLGLWDHRHAANDRELDVGWQHLEHVWAADGILWHDSGLQDLDGRSLSTVTTGHFRKHLAHSTVDGGISVLLVHIVGVGTGLVSQPDAIVGNLGWRLVKQFSLTQDLTSRSLGLVDLIHKVPELGSSPM